MVRNKDIFSVIRLIVCFFSVFLLNNKVFALSATDTIRAETFSGKSGVTTENCSEGGQDVTSIQNGDYIYFENVDFGTSGIQCFEARVAGDGNGGFIELRLDSQTGTLIGTCEILPPTGNWQTWTNKACKVTGATGVHSLYLVFTGGVGSIPVSNLFNLNWFKFHGTPSLNKANWRQTTNSAKGVLNTPITLSDASGSNPVIQVNPDSTFQRVDGWGGAFNENGYHCISLLSAGLRTAVMKELYDPVSGCRFNYGRVPIGMSDFTVNKVYSLDELPAGVTSDYNMQYFSLHNDSLMNIAFVKAAMAVNPNIMIYGSPWTPPSWMKTNKSWEGGNNPIIIWNDPTLTAYALYFSKFVKGWKQAGISVSIVYPQNEPGFNTSGHPSCAWNGTTMKNWVRDYLYPKFKADSICTQIWMGTFNGSYYTDDEQPTLDDPQARTMITGIGVQRDGNNALATTTQNAYYRSQHYHSMQTETNCWNGANSWSDAMNTFTQIWNHETANVNIYNMWNMILDANYNYVSWMTRAQNSMITITPASQTVTYNPEFYVMKHWSYYIRTGAVRVLTSSSNSNLRVMSFKNPDGSIILEVQNNASSVVSPLIRIGTKEFTPSLAASSVNTFNIGGNEPAGNWVPATGVQFTPAKKIINSTAKGMIGIYDIKGRLIQVLDRTGSNTSDLNWDRTNTGGRLMSSGMYIIKNQTVGNSTIHKVVCPLSR